MEHGRFLQLPKRGYFDGLTDRVKRVPGAPATSTVIVARSGRVTGALRFRPCFLKSLGEKMAAPLICTVALVTFFAPLRSPLTMFTTYFPGAATTLSSNSSGSPSVRV